MGRGSLAVLTVVLAPASNACLAVAISDILMAAEQSIVVWDSKSKTEDFIRDVAFVTNAKDFGFIVPVPSSPSLAPAPKDSAFSAAMLLKRANEALENWEYQAKAGVIWDLRLLLAADSGAEAAGVEVLFEGEVAGYQAAVLKSRQPSALSGWLQRNGYPTPLAARNWIAHYSQLDFYFAAFKFVPKSEGDAPTGPIRIRFKTERPYFPYREPPAPKGGPERTWACTILTDIPALPSYEDGPPASELFQDVAAVVSAAEANSREFYGDRPKPTGHIFVAGFSRKSALPRRDSDLLWKAVAGPEIDQGTWLISERAKSLRARAKWNVALSWALYVAVYYVCPALVVGYVLLRIRNRRKC